MKEEKRHFQIYKTSTNLSPMQPFSRIYRCAPSKQENKPSHRKIRSTGKWESTQERHQGTSWQNGQEDPRMTTVYQEQSVPSLDWSHVIPETDMLKTVTRNIPTAMELSFEPEDGNQMPLSQMAICTWRLLAMR